MHSERDSMNFNSSGGEGFLTAAGCLPLKLAPFAYDLVMVTLLMTVLLKSASDTSAPDNTLSAKFFPVYTQLRRSMSLSETALA